MSQSRSTLEAECGFTSSLELVRLGPTLSVRIGFDTDYRPGKEINLPDTEYFALVDTGASLSCIDSSIAATLKLPVVDQMDIAGVQGKSKVNMHLAHILIPALEAIVYGRFAAVHLNAGGQPHSALIGRLFLNSCLMTYDGFTGSVTLSRRKAA